MSARAVCSVGDDDSAGVDGMLVIDFVNTCSKGREGEITEGLLYLPK